MAAIWGKGKTDEKNCTLAFFYDYKGTKGDEIFISITASNIYKLYICGELIGYGPARAAHGFARIDEYKIKAPKDNFRIVAEVVSYRVNSYYLINEEPFFDCTISVDNVIKATSDDFSCYHLNDRVQKVQRFSFQRPFIECYNNSYNRTNLYLGKDVTYPIVENCHVSKREYLQRGVKYPVLDTVYPQGVIEEGSVEINKNNPTWQDRSHLNIGDTLLGFTNDELTEKISDEVCFFDYTKNGMGDNSYFLYEFCNLQTGLINLSIDVLEDCVVYLVFEEILWEEENKSDKNSALNLCFWRGECANIIKYHLKKGSYNLSSFEIYTLKFLKVIKIGGSAKIKDVSITKIESPATYDFKFNFDDIKLQKIFTAAVNTFSHNSLDLLMDCPARERAGWTNDSYFSSEIAKLFTGNRNIELNFIENILKSPDLEQLPKGALPMCYPCDHLNGEYSSTCSMWFILEVCKYCHDALNDEIPEYMAERIKRFIAFIDGFINDDGLLEDLDLKNWVFIEWSLANNAEYVCGVNYPANMLYSKMLLEFGKIINDNTLIYRSEKMKQKIIEQSFNGKCFEDNRVRENGELVLKGHITETCQYFAFFLGIADKKDYAKLFNTLADTCKYHEVPKNEKDYRRSNVIVGLILRESLLLQDGRFLQVVEECTEILYKMAERTGTLWENVDVRASCNHNIAAFFTVLLMYAMTGYRGVENNTIIINRENAGIDCDFSFNCNGTYIKIKVKNGETTIKSDYEVYYK